MFCSVNAIYCTIRLSKHYISNCLLIIDIYCLFFGTIKLPLCTCGFIFSVYKIIRGSLKKLIFHFVEINAVNIKIQFDNIQNHIVITNNNNCKRLILFFNNFWQFLNGLHRYVEFKYGHLKLFVKKSIRSPDDLQ